MRDSFYYLLFGLVLVLSAVRIQRHIPDVDGYYLGADEGTYYRQAKAVEELRLSGFSLLAEQFLQESRIQPPPLRLGHVLLASLSLTIHDSIRSLSYLSLASYVTWVLLTFLYVRKSWGIEVALFTGCLLCSSPLASGLSTRALMDTEHALFLTLVLFAFLNFLQSATPRNATLLVLSFTASILVKEPTLLFLPFFFATAIVARWWGSAPIRIGQIALLTTLPVVVALLSYWFVFGDIRIVGQLMNLLVSRNVLQTFPYKANFLSGPWYQYFVDYWVLAPAVSTLFLGYCGFYWTNHRKDLRLTVLQSFFAYTIFVYSFMSKDVRYVVVLDVVYRLFAVLMVLTLFERLAEHAKLRRVLVVSTFAVLLLMDARKFQRIFVDHGVYDPITFNLMIAESFFADPYRQSAPGDTVERAAQQLSRNPSAETYLELSFRYYRSGRFEKSIEAADRALLLNPDYPEAYNNRCASYNQLRDWQNAIESCERALELRPDWELAKANLAWARQER
jgi:hypothetical protein